MFLYAEARTRFLSSDEYRNLRRALKSQAYLTASLEREFAAQQHELVRADLSPEVVACCEAGLLRPISTEIIVRNIVAGILYESTVHEVILGEEAPLKVADVIKYIFVPLLTEKGEQQLREYLQQQPAQ